MTNLRRRSRLGFTLIELAIVLSVIGLMSVGLWRLLSSGNQQMKDAATAGQQIQLINAAKSFLASADGQTFLGGKCVTPAGCTAAAVGSFSLPLPTAAAAAGSAGCPSSSLTGMTASQVSTWCTTLPLGFSVNTTNSYGQTYAIKNVWNSPTTSAGTAPSAYSFMIMTSGGDTIPDTSGGRVSSQIGGDGGFVYSNDVCTTGSTSKTTACGAYGAWSTTLTTFGFATPANGGYVSSQTYYAAESNSSGPWLARLNIGTPSTYNTMFTTLYLGGQQMTNNTTGAADASNIKLYGNGTAIGLDMKNLGGPFVGAQPLINLNSNCGASSMTSPGSPNTCPYALQITGDATVTNILNANVFYSNSDIRLKKNVRPLTNALDDIMRLKPVTFTFKSNDTESLGLIAQDIDKVYPQLVSHGDEAAMKSVNYQGLIAPLIAAVQELKRQNDTLRQELHTQELREQKLEQDMKSPKPDSTF